MNTRTTAIMTVAVLAGFAVILLMNTVSFFGVEAYKYLSPNMIRGIAVQHNELLYTLNFDQQNRFIGIINRSIPITQAMLEKRKASGQADQEIQRVIIYQFNAPDLEVKPVAYVNKLNSAPGQDDRSPLAMAFTVQELAPSGLLEETTPGELKQLFSETYDP